MTTISRVRRSQHDWWKVIGPVATVAHGNFQITIENNGDEYLRDPIVQGGSLECPVLAILFPPQGDFLVDCPPYGKR